MKKSIYSVVLMDDVVAAIDGMASRLNTNRSTLINQILADKMNLDTPERRIRSIFDKFENLLDDGFLVKGRSSRSMLMICSQIEYKYKPSIRYSIELYVTAKNGSIGRLKMGFRTKNTGLLSCFEDFFRLFYKLEQHYISGAYPNGIECSLTRERFTRNIYLPKGTTSISAEELAGLLADYIKFVDNLIKIYFSMLNDKARATAAVTRNFEKALEDGVIPYI